MATRLLPTPCVLAPCALLMALGGRTAAAEPSAVEFNRDVRPVLADHCFQCHGPDKAKRKAGLRLDTPPADAGRDGSRLLVPGDPSHSELFLRLTAADPKKRMPPRSTGRSLSEQQIALVRRWIEQGANWQPHWAFIPPKRPPVPVVRQAGWVRNPIDAFVLARLEREGLAPAAEADRATLLRRVTLDLTGLPSTPADVDAFLADTAPGAYERAVDRLLASPRYGERMAARWLDAARYADTNGYQSDGERTMWRWRDWIIDAYNRNMPFDQFTVEQLAGDLLPNPTLEQRIATGFNRNHRGNAEGGIIPEEYAVEYVVDRVDTTATVWLGLTLACARCHEHKFDPFPQREFYQVFAYFNNVPERGKAVKYGNSPPMIQAPTAAQQEQLAELDWWLAAVESAYRRLQPQLAAAQADWERTFRPTGPLPWALSRAPLAQFALDGDGGTGKFVDGSPAFVPGRVGQAADFDGKRYLHAGDVARFGYYDKFTLAAWVKPRGPHGGTILSRMADVPRGDGYSLGVGNGRVQVNLVKRWLDDALRVETEESLTPGRWHHVTATYDGSRVAGGVRVYIDGRPAKLRVLLDDLNQSFVSAEPLRIGAGHGPAGRFQGAIGDVRIYADVLSAAEAEVLAVPEGIAEILAVPVTKRTPGQVNKLRLYYLDNHLPQSARRVRRELLRLRRERARLVESFPTTMVMQEMPEPRETHVLVRGQYDKPGAKVSPGIPKVLGTLPPGGPSNRLAFARWLVDPANPLTARVAVNRFWQMYFGTGLVKTVDDFGAQGEMPSHPELLDWLATEFIRTGWDVKAMQWLIVTSATYRQSSKLTDAKTADPENRLLARGPRSRLSAEMVRDQALAAGGLLVEQLGGASVKPYQPAGLWNELADTEYGQDHGRDLYRRSLYTFWKRTVPPPALMTFDAAGRETCVVRVSRTNTPLQALNLMNDVTYVEAARVLAQRVMTEGGTEPAARLALAFRLATARPPKPAELRILLDSFRRNLSDFRRDREAARKLVSVGEYPRDAKLDVSELAAYTAVASLILNLDETITKE